MTDEKPLTAGELIEALRQIPADTVVYSYSHDHDYDMWFHWSISGVTPHGELEGGDIIASGSLSDDDENDDQ